MPPAFVRAQLDAVLGDVGADAVKTGMLRDARTVDAVADRLIAYGRPPLVIDPVITAKDGTTLLGPAGVRALRARLVPLATVITPNRAEAAALTGVALADDRATIEAARALRALGARAVVVTGGDRAGDASDLLLTDDGAVWLRARRVPGAAAHGTGCTFAAAIAAELAKGVSIRDAVGRAKRYVTRCIRRAQAIGAGHPVLAHGRPS